MPTPNYKLPTLDASAKMDLVTQLNALATAVDAALKRVDDKIQPPATMQTITTWEQLKNYGAYAPTTQLSELVE